MTQTISKKFIALIIALSVALSSALIASVAIVNNKSTANAGSVMMTPKMRKGWHGTTYQSTDGSVGAAYCSLMDRRYGPGNGTSPSAVSYTAPSPTNSIYLEPDGTAPKTESNAAIIKQIGYMIAAFGYDPPANDPYRGILVKQVISKLTNTPWRYAEGGNVESLANMVAHNARTWGTVNLQISKPVLKWNDGKDNGKVGQLASLSNIGITNEQHNLWWSYSDGMSTHPPMVKITLTGDIAVNAPGQPKVWNIPYNQNYNPTAPIGLIRTGTGKWSYNIEIINVPDNTLLQQYPQSSKYQYQNLLSGRLKTLKADGSTTPPPPDKPKPDVSLEFSSDISSKIIEPGTPFHDTGHVKAKSNDPDIPATWPQREFNWRDSDGKSHTSSEPVPFRIKFHLWGPLQTPIQEGENPGLNRLPPRRDNTPGVAVFS